MLKKIIIALVAVSFIVLQSFNLKKSAKPNVILIFMDDMGYGDLSSYGATGYSTPNIDRIGHEGARLTNFLAAQAVCSASRAALLTGCYPNRIGITGALFPNSPIGLNADETTLAEMFKEAGYSTGMIGKWHLGDHEDFSPLNNGFDQFYGLPYSNDMWPVDFGGHAITDTTNYRYKAFPPLFLLDGKEKVKEVKTLDDQAELVGDYTNHALSFIKKKKDKPFFLYLAHSMPHVPIAVSSKFKGKSEQGIFGDMMMEIDHSVGEIMSSLKANGLDENTIVIFTSDNGPWLTFGNHAGSSGGFREGKQVSFEGGMRVPCLIRWPEKIKPGTIFNKLSSTIDLFPTLVEASGGTLPNNKIDGVNLLPALTENSSLTPRSQFYYYYGSNNLEAVREGNWKLILPHPGLTYKDTPFGHDGQMGMPKRGHQYEMQLFNLNTDPGEEYDLKDQFPEVVSSLLKLAEEARADLGDDLSKMKGQNVRPAGKIQAK